MPAHRIETRQRHMPTDRPAGGPRQAWGFALAACIAMGLGASACGGGGSGNGGYGGKVGSGGSAGGPGRGATGGGPGTGTGGAAPVDAGAGTGGLAGGDASVAAGELGKACASVADCGAGLICLLPTDKLIFGQGGPAHGYCTMPCLADADLATCAAADGECVDMAATATDPSQVYCMQKCIFGEAGAASKCRMRPDVACTTLSEPTPDGGAPAEETSVCIPTCSQDSECPAGRKCDDALSVCVDVKSPGEPLGTHCDPNAATDTCGGFCLPLGDGATVVASFCSRRCVLGNLMGCGWVDKTMSLATGGPHGICVVGADGARLGDLGFCVQQCATVADCTNKDPGGTCDTMTLNPQLNSHGYCSW